MTRNDPYTPSGDYLYECPACGHREWSEKRLGRCPECGVDMQNIAVPRE